MATRDFPSLLSRGTNFRFFGATNFAPRDGLPAAVLLVVVVVGREGRPGGGGCEGRECGVESGEGFKTELQGEVRGTLAVALVENPGGGAVEDDET